MNALAEGVKQNAEALDEKIAGFLNGVLGNLARSLEENA